MTSLRGIFILFIFFHHLHLYDGGGTMAVAFFFVLGGFSMTLGYKERILKSDFSFRDYITKRCVKFYPLHWLTLLVAVPLVLLSFNWKQIPVFFMNASLLQTMIPMPHVYFSYNGVSWYLADTMFFAFVFPFLLKWIVNASSKGKILIATFFAVIYAAGAIIIPTNMHHAILYISPYMRLTDFVFGIYLALGYLKLKEKPINFYSNNLLTQVSVFVLIALLVVESCVLSEDAVLFAPVYWPLVALLIVLVSLSEVTGGYKWLQNKYLQRLGEFSFTIFLTHQLIIRYTRLILGKILHFENDIVFVILTLSLTIVVSIVVEKYILKPITVLNDN
ncbi:MAG: acyltransferase [Prevotella sp.]|nr:acyltransferase [Prevotella sp.]